MVFLILLLVPLPIAVFGFIVLKGVTWKEVLAQVVVQALLAVSVAAIVSCQNESDIEVWNGSVASKKQTWVSCSHSYSCNCRQECSGSGKDQRCSQKCDTCYEHSNDWDWDVYTTNREVVTIARVDRQGAFTPPRWTAVVIGEPTAVEHSYRNYIKAAPDTLFRHQGLKAKYQGRLPAYPGRVYDYYRLDRVVTVGVSLPDAAEWSAELTQINAELGRARQANMIIVLVRNMPGEYYYALEEAWIGGKKNDVVLVVSVDDAMKPQWAEVMAWTTRSIFKVKLRDDIMDEPVLDRKAAMAALRTNVSTYFQRKPMKEFEYLRASATPSTTQWVVTLLISVITAIGLTWYFHVYDPFGPGGFRFNRLPWARRAPSWRRQPWEEGY